MQDTKKKSVSFIFIESAIFVLIWLMILLIPIGVNQAEGILLWDRIMESWIKIASFLFVFILNIYVLIPLYLKKKQYERYILLILAITPLIICFSIGVENNYTTRSVTGMPPMELSERMPPPAGFRLQNQSATRTAEMQFLQSLVIALLVIGTGTAYKVILFWMEEEKQKKQLQVQQDNQHIDEYIYVKSDLKMVKVLISDILYIESANEYIKIYLNKGESITTFMRLKNIETKLPADRFMRVQRSFIVNLDKIQAVEKNRIFIEQKKFIPIGEQYKESFQQYLGRNFIK